ncbi:hypothetical protein V6N12_042941 [Hibiscus sabdariffa]|uniref:Uncharacterized protein n=1 Tax=Hibiscus sabdariffa TaxID=183260 RepID=A0ABR2AWY4_9ROSI
MLVWCASSGMSMPLLAAMIALVVGSMLSRPVTVSGAVFAFLAWHPHLFSWCASKIPGAATLRFARPKVASFPRPHTLVTVAAFLAEGSMNRPLLDLGTPAPMAFGGCLCTGCPSKLFADWLTLLRVEGQKFQYGAWLRAPLPKRSAAHPRGRLSLVDDGQGAPAVDEPLDSTLDPPAQVTDATAQSDPSTQSVPVVPTPVDPVAPEVAAPVVRAGSVESSVAAPRGRAASAAPSSAAPMVRHGPTAPASAAPVAEGEDLVNEVVPEVADSIIGEVAASILGVDESPADPDAPVALAQ